MEILAHLRLRSDPLLKKLGLASSNLALVMPNSLSRHQLCGKENENFTCNVLHDNSQRTEKENSSGDSGEVNFQYWTSRRTWWQLRTKAHLRHGLT